MKKIILILLTILFSLNGPVALCAKNKASQTEQHVSYQEDAAPVETIYVNETNCNVQHGASTNQMIKTGLITAGTATLATAGIIFAAWGTAQLIGFISK